MTVLINAALHNQIVSTFANGMDLVNLLNKLNDSAVKNPLTADLDMGGFAIQNIGGGPGGDAATIRADGSAAFATGALQIGADGTISTNSWAINPDGTATFYSGFVAIDNDGSVNAGAFTQAVSSGPAFNSNASQPCNFTGVAPITTSTLSGPTKTAIESLCTAFGISIS